MCPAHPIFRVDTDDFLKALFFCFFMGWDDTDMDNLPSIIIGSVKNGVYLQSLGNISYTPEFTNMSSDGNSPIFQ